VAAGYQPQQYLIGPNIFPTYRYVLKLACSWATIIYSIVTVVQLFATHKVPANTALLDAVLHLPWVLITAAAWVTMIFAAIEFAVMRGYVKLPALCAPLRIGRRAICRRWATTLHPARSRAATPRPLPRSVFGILFLGWLLLIPQHPYGC
jgi:hypothetical protein